jgi:uncharacterized protein YndB with AHSA1/START domain
METVTENRKLEVERLLDAPVELVWEVWTNPDHIKNWWGPDGFSTTISKMDIRKGGEWNLVMHGPDGTDYKNKSVFREIIKNKSIEFDHVSGPKFTARVTFEAKGKKTLMKWSMIFESAEVKNQVVEKFGAAEGLRQNVAKLESYLTKWNQSLK